MAVSTLSALSTSLKQVYDDSIFEVMYNTNVPFFNLLKQVKSVRPEGAGLYFPFYLRSPQNIGTPAEAGNLPVVNTRTEVQGYVQPGQMIGTFEMSFIFEAVGTQRGSFNKDEVKRHSLECISDLTKHVNRLYAGTHGTGRLGQVNATTSSLATFVGKLPLGTLLMRPNMMIDVYSADTSGSVRTGANAVKITDIAPTTRTVTFDDGSGGAGSASLTADDHVYIDASYGNATVPNGIAGLIDDGTLLTTVHNQSRSTYTELKSVATAAASGSNLANLTEDMLVRMALDIRQRSGSIIDCLLMNTGQIEKYLAFVRPDRRYPQSGAGVPKYDTGYQEEPLTFVYGGKRCPMYVSEDIHPRRIYFVNKSKLRLGTLKKMSWYDHGGGNIFAQGVNSTGYKTTQQATLVHIENLVNLQPNAHGVLTSLSDPQLCGTSVGGADT